MSIEIVNHACAGILENPMSPHEEIYYPTVVGASLYYFEDNIHDARIHFMNGANRDHHCAIEVETSMGPVTCEGHGRSRSAAFMMASEHLERRLFEGIHGEPGPGGAQAGPAQMAA